MNQYRVSDAARSDLDEIWLYIAQDNPDAATNTPEPLSLVFRHWPRCHSWDGERSELSPRLRSFVVGRHIIFYRPLDNGVEITRVLDGARDLPPLFE